MKRVLIRYNIKLNTLVLHETYKCTLMDVCYSVCKNNHANIIKHVRLNFKHIINSLKEQIEKFKGVRFETNI